MKAVLICPAERPAVAELAENAPLVLAPLLGKSLIEYWLAALVARGVKDVLVLASDRPHAVRQAIGDGTRWGLRVELKPQPRELTPAEARARFLPAAAPAPHAGARATPAEAAADAFADANAAPPGDLVFVVDRLPALPELPLFESYAGWFAALEQFLPRAITPDRIGAREIQPGVWVGLHAQISPRATLHAPCWIGEHALIGDDAVIGPGAILEDRVVIERGARVARSTVGPETFVGEFISVQDSLASGGTIVNWKTGSCLRVPDAFFLCSLNDRRFSSPASGLIPRVLAAAAMLATLPVAVALMMLSLVRGETPLVLRLGVRPQHNVRSGTLQTFAYYELAAGRTWLRRWPQFWSVIRGDLNWVGNRPLRPTQALALANDFERLWLTAPVGLVSLADAHGCVDEVSDEVCAHASYYAVNASWRLDCFVLTRAFWRALASWPIRRARRKEVGVSLPQLVPKQEI